MDNDLQIKKMQQIKATVVEEYDNFSREDVEFSYDDDGNIDNENDILWYEERVKREKDFNDSIANIDEILYMLGNRANTIFE